MSTQRTVQLNLTELPDLQTAWTAVMEHVDEFVHARIELHPVVVQDSESNEHVSYTVVISGQPAVSIADIH
jgi:hypothetical protein